MLLPFIGVIVFTGIYPQADARADRALRRPVDRPRRGAGRLRVAAEPDGRPRSKPTEEAERLMLSPRSSRHHRSSGGTSARSSPSCRVPCSCSSLGALDTDVAARRVRRGHGADLARGRRCWPCSSGTRSPTTARRRCSTERWRSTAWPSSSRSRSARRRCWSRSSPPTTCTPVGRDAPEVYALLLVSATGGVVMAVGQRPDRALPRARDAVAGAVRARRIRPRPDHQPGVRHQVLRARRLRLGVLPLRDRLDLRRHAVDQHLRDHRRASRARCSIDGQDSLVLAGIALLIVGLGFKVAAVPFHVWTPDVYQGAPTNVTAFMASVGKAAAFAAMLRVLVIALPVPSRRLAARDLGAGGAVVGDRFGARRRPERRQAHARLLVDQPRRFHPRRRRGRRVIGPASRSTATACPASSPYLLLYSVLTVGSFAIVAVVGRQHGGDTSVDAFNGLADQATAAGVRAHRVPAGAGGRAAHARASSPSGA